MSTNINEAAESLQNALSVCDSLEIEIKRALDGKTALIDAGIDEKLIHDAVVSLEKALRNCHKTRRALQATGLMLKDSADTLETAMKTDDPVTFGPLICGC